MSTSDPTVPAEPETPTPEPVDPEHGPGVRDPETQPAEPPRRDDDDDDDGESTP